jgi:hypothetical protein
VELEISYPGQSAESMGVITIDILSEGGDYFTDYSEKLKIPVPDGGEVDVTLESFIVFDAEGNRIWIAPIAPDDDPDLYDGYVQNPLELVFSVQDGTKPYIDVEVLCYDRRMANEYGYVFFDVVPEKIYPYCLFINYCDENGRHFVANYSVDLYYGPDDTGIQLYDGVSLDDMDDADYGIVDDNYYSDPLCLIVPGKPNALGAGDPYLFLVIYPNDWVGNYGDIDNSPIEVQLSWNDVNGLLNADGTTNEYDHLIIGECEGALSGDGSGGNGGGNECDKTDPNANCDGDDDLNKCDRDNPNFGTFDCDGDGKDNEQEGECYNNPDPNCGENGGGDPEFTCTFNTDCITWDFDQSEATSTVIGYEIYDGDTLAGTLNITTTGAGVVIDIGMEFGYLIDDVGVILDDGTEKCYSNRGGASFFNETIPGDFNEQTNIQVLLNYCPV